MAKREYKNDDEYKKFRQEVRKRDKRRCMWPDCDSPKFRLNVHHILPWKTHPHLRYEVSNGICLCKHHHNQVTKHEITYALFLSRLIK